MARDGLGNETERRLPGGIVGRWEREPSGRARVHRVEHAGGGHCAERSGHLFPEAIDLSMILFDWQLEPQPSGEPISILRANGLLMSDDMTLVLGCFPGSILLIPTLHEAARRLDNMRVPAGPLYFDLVGDSPIVGITVDAGCEARLSYRGTVI